MAQADTYISKREPVEGPGLAQAVFPTQGIVVPGISTSSITIMPASTTVSSATLTSNTASVSSRPSTTSAAFQRDAILIVVGSIFSAIVIFAILVLLTMFLIRGRRTKNKRWSFHREMMIQSRPPSSPSISHSASIAHDLERGLPDPVPVVPPNYRSSQDPQWPLPDPMLHPVSPIVAPQASRPAPLILNLNPPCTPLPPLPNTPRSPFIARSPLTSRPSRRLPTSPRLRSPMPRSPSPRTHRQRAIADQIEMLRIQMLQFERASRKDGGAVMDEMCKKMAWLREQQEGPWALGLTEATPLGYDHYMT